MLKPSDAGIWWHCPGYDAMSAGVPRGEPTEAQLFGIEADRLACEALKEKRDVTDASEAGEVAQAFVEAVRSRLANPSIQEHVPTGRLASNLTEAVIDAWGTSTDGFHIFEFKAGHSYVDHIGNKQLLVEALALSLAAPVTLHVVQPRAFGHEPHRWVTLTEQDLADARNELKLVAWLAAQPDAKVTPGPHCRGCKARLRCNGAAREAALAADYAYDRLPMDLTADELGAELRMLERAHEALTYRYKAVQNDVESRLKKGTRVAHWALEPTRGKQSWSLPEADIAALLPEAAVTKAMTPLQAVKAGADADMVEALSARTSGMKLTRHDDASMAKIFQRKTK